MSLDVNKNRRWTDIVSGRCSVGAGSYMGDSLHGTENDLIIPLHGRVFQSDYPFKIKVINSDAPIFTGDLNVFFNPTQLSNLKVNVSVCIQTGNIYDLSKIDINKKGPIAISKRQNGKYKLLSKIENSLLNESDLEVYKILLYLNGAEMKSIDLTSASEMQSQSLTLSFEYNDNGIGFKSNGTNYSDCNIYLVLSFSTKNGGYFSDKFDLISSANILTGKQIIEQKIDDGTKTILCIFDAVSKSGYYHLPIDSNYFNYLKTKSIFKIDPWSPGFNPNVTFVKNEIYERNYEDSAYFRALDNDKIFNHYFRIENDFDTNVSDLNLFDHLFLRSYRR